MTHTSLIAILTLGLSAIIGQAGDMDSGKLILNDKEPSLVKISLDTRLRYEYGDTETLAASTAATIRNRVGLLTKEVNGFQAFVQYEGTLAADRDEYFGPGAERPTGQTPIADPESHELNQAWVSYQAPSDIWGLKVGRQEINLDNQRFIGTVAWRQNEQTYDAVGVTFNPTDELEVYYGFIWQVNRIFGSETFLPPTTDFTGNSHIFNAKYSGLSIGTLTSYVYSLDLHNDAGDIFSSDTFGFILSGDFIGESTYWAEWAHQVDGHANPRDYSANYVHTNVSREIFPGVEGTIGMEWMGSDNGNSFQFPLGTNHKFGGFADNFLVTPAAGLSDIYATVGTKIAGIKVVGGFHYYEDDGFDTAFGHEFDLVAVKPITDNVTALIKAAQFYGQNGQPDTTRANLELNIKY